MQWRPLLAGENASRVRARVLEIATAVEQLPSMPLLGFKGDASPALLLGYCNRSSAARKLEDALAAAAMQPSTVSLFGGICGTAWVVRHLAQEDEAEEIIAHVDAALLRRVTLPRWDERHDLMSGLAGIGAYVTGRRDARALRIAECVLSHLETTAMYNDTGVTWRTHPGFLHPQVRERYPDGVVDLGVAHGVPGIIGMLAQFVEADIAPERSRRLLESAIAWLLHAAPVAVPRFGSYWPAEPDEFRRIGWCYGDAGVAGILLYAGQVLGTKLLEVDAVQMLEQLADILPSHHIRDCGFCHGIAGLAHIYNVAFQRTGDLKMRAIAEYWLGEVLQRYKLGSGIAGYASLKTSPADDRWDEDATLLSGATGIALVLLAAIENHVPQWQSLFLL